MPSDSRQRRAQDTVLYVFLLAVLVYLCVRFSPAAGETVSLRWILERCEAIRDRPLELTRTESTPRLLLAVLPVYTFFYLAYVFSRRNTLPGREYGSASWGDPAAVARKYRDSAPDSNLLLTRTLRLGLDTHRHRRNLNVMVIGGSGAGKTRFYAMPNLMQGCFSYVVCDPKGELRASTASLMEEMGYTVKVLDLIDMSRSGRYNPFAYIRTENDVLRLVNNLIVNTTPKNARESDPFWTKSETALLQALILYLREVQEDPEKKSFGEVMNMLRSMDVREEDETYKNEVDLLFQSLEDRNPQSVAVKQYRVFKLAAGKTARSILVSVGVRLASFNLPDVIRLTSGDEMDIAALGERKCVLYCCIPDNDSSFNFIVGLLYTQIFQTLYSLADRKYNGRLPVPVHFLMDEFANCAQIAHFERLLSTMRSRGISVSIILQNLSQLKALYKDSWESIAGNCDTLLYLGGNELSTHEYITKLLGKSTIDTTTHGRTRGRSGSSSDNFQQTGRELMTIDEVRRLDNRCALAFIRGEKPVIDEKYDLTRHPRYSRLKSSGAPAVRPAASPKTVCESSGTPSDAFGLCSEPTELEENV